MSTHTHQTAPNQFVESNDIRFAYRRFGISTDRNDPDERDAELRPELDS